MSDIVLVTHTAEQVWLRSVFPDGAGDLNGLARLTGAGSLDAPSGTANLTVGSQSPAGKKKYSFSSLDFTLFYDRSAGSFEIVPGDEAGSVPDDSRKSDLWMMYIYFALLSAIFRGNKLLLIHGAMLKVSGGALLLLGESGVGKSTSARRFKEAGLRSPADDMILLEYGGDELFVHPMPTWSSCRLGLEGKYFPVNDIYPLRDLLCIARGKEREEILPVSFAEYFTQIYSSCFFFHREIAKMFRDGEREMLLNAVRSAADEIVKRFPPRALFAHLEGNIAETLGKYL